MEAAAAGESGGDSDSDSYGFPGQVDESSSPPQNSADAVDRLPGQPDPEKNELDRRRKSGTEQTPAPPSVRRGYTASHNYSDAEGQRMDERSSSISRGQLMLDMMNTETNVDEQWSVVWAENDDNPDPESSSVQQTAAIVHTSGKADDDGAPSAVVDKFTNEDLDVQFAVGPDSDVQELLEIEKLLEGDASLPTSMITLRELRSRMHVVKRIDTRNAKEEQKAVHGFLRFPSSTGLPRTATYVRLYAGDIAKKWPTSEKPTKATNVEHLRESAETASHFIQCMMEKRFGESDPELLKPSLVLSVTGGATSLQLSDSLEKAIVDGLSSAIRKSKAWVISGGTNVGVMKKIGEVMRSLTEEKQGFVVPVIGVATWGIVKGREGLDVESRALKDYKRLMETAEQQSYKCKKEQTEPSYDAHQSDVELDPNHNMFFLVDDGTEAKFGGELQFRAALEEKIHSTYKATVVSVMIQGGPNTIVTSFQALKKGTPLVVIEDSGGAADVIAYAWNFLHSGSLLHAKHTYNGLQKKIEPLIANTKAAEDREKFRGELPEMVLDIVRVREMVVLYSNKTSEYPSLEDAILRAVFNKLRLDIVHYVNEYLRDMERNAKGRGSQKDDCKPEGKREADQHHKYRKQLVLTCQFPLQHATNFNRLDLAEEELDLLEDQLVKLGGLDLQENQQQGSVLVNVLNKQLLYALKNNAPDFVELYLSRGAMASGLRPSPSFKFDEEQSKEVYNLESGNVPPFVLAVEELYRGAGLKSDSHIASLARHAGQTPRLKLCNNSKLNSEHKIPVDGERRYNVEHMERILTQCADDALILKRIWSVFDEKVKNKEEGKNDKDEDKVEENKRENTANHILFMWALCLNKYRVAEFFWLRTNHNVANALAARCILANLAKHSALQGKRLTDAREKLLHNAEKWEDLAWGVLATCNADDSRETSAMLQSHLPLFNENDAMAVAYKARCLEFLSHAAVQAKVEKDWKGKAGTDSGNDTRDNGWCSAEPIGEASGGSRSWELWRPSPRNRFRIDLISYLALCILLSYVVLDVFKNTVGRIEWTLCVWFAALVTEEIRELSVSMALVSVETREYCKAAQNHFISWNSIDLVILVIYFVGFIVRISKPSDEDMQINAKAIFSVLAVFLWTRLLRYYAVNKTLGPKVVMIFHMLRDVSAFIALLGAFLLGCGVAAQGILAPARPIDGASIANVFYQPYFRLYGELFLDESEEQAGCSDRSLPFDLLMPFSKCRQSRHVWLAPVLIAVYMLVANVLLLNLLIAQFNETYIRVQEKAKQHWNLRRYELLLEYKSKPWLPGPLMLLWNTALLLVWLGRQCRRCGISPDGSGSRDREAQLLDMFESRNTRLFIEERRLQRSQNIDCNVQTLLTTVDSLIRKNDHNREMLNTLLSRQLAGDSHSAQDAAGAHDNIQTIIEGVIEKIKLIPTGNYCDLEGRQIERKRKVLKGNQSSDAGDEPLFYTRDIHDPPGFEDPDQEGYHPKVLPEIPPDPSDDGLDAIDFYGDATQKQVWRRSIRWQEIVFEEGPHNATRRGAHLPATSQDPAAAQRQLIECLQGGHSDRGRPINPFGKTGLRGRGVLWRWGTNWAADLLLTRFRRDPVTDAPLMRNGCHVLEFLCMKRPNGDWAIPGCIMLKDARVNDEELKAQLKSMLKKKVLGVSSGLAETKQDEILDQLFKLTPKSKHDAYSADPRNTDNAWIETQCWHIHDSTGTLMDGLDLRHFPQQEQEKEEEKFRQREDNSDKQAARKKAAHAGDGKMRGARSLAAWMMVHPGLKLFASHGSLLEVAALELNAYYRE